MSVSSFLHSVIDKVSGAATMTTNLPERRILANNVDPETAQRFADSINQYAITHLPYVAAQENTMSTAAPVPAPPAHHSFYGFLQSVGKFIEKGLGFAVQYAPSAGALFSILFPTLSPEAATAVTALDLIQKAVISVEQKYAAAGVQNGTGAQKSAEVLTLTEGAVTSLLTQAGVKNVTTDYIQSIVTAVVGILNAHGAITA